LLFTALRMILVCEVCASYYFSFVPFTLHEKAASVPLKMFVFPCTRMQSKGRVIVLSVSLSVDTKMICTIHRIWKHAKVEFTVYNLSPVLQLLTYLV